MNNGLNEVERFQKLKEKVDEYNAKIIENEVKKKNAEEELQKLQEDLKTLGYNSIDEANKAYQKLQEEVRTTLDDMEAKLNAIN